jgi:carbamoyl-phosphate synthase large subunit
MGIAESFGIAFAKAQLAAENALPRSGAIFVTVNDRDKATVAPLVKRFHAMGFRIIATSGTAAFLAAQGIPTEKVFKVHEGRPHAVDLIVNREIVLLINTPMGKHAQRDDYTIRQAAIANRVAYTTTLSAASAACDAIEALAASQPGVRPLQDWHAMLAASRAVHPA